MKKKMLFEEPELEVVRFDPKDIYTAASGCDLVAEDSEQIVDCGEDDMN